MRKEVKAYIEAELRGYNDTVKELEREQMAIIEGNAQPVDGNKGSLPGKPTEQKAMRLATSKHLLYIERVVRAIDVVLAGLDEDKYKLVELVYWTKPQPFRDIGIANQLCISRQTFYRWRDGILQAIAVEIGLIDIPGLKYAVKKIEKR